MAAKLSSFYTLEVAFYLFFLAGLDVHCLNEKINKKHKENV